MADGGAGVEPAAVQHVRLPFHPPLDGQALLDFLARRAVPGVEEVEGLVYRRTFHDASAVGRLEVRFPDGDDPPSLVLSAQPAAGAAVVDRCRRLFALDLVPGEAAAVLREDPALAPLVDAAAGLRVPGAWDGFELAVRAVLGQQVSVAAARTLLGRLAALAGAPVGGAAGEGRLFPTADEVAMADLDRLGVPASRRRTLRALAEAVAEGQVSLEPGVDVAETCARLQQLPGVGPWTAAYVALRALGDADSLLVGDVALMRGAVRCGLPDRWPELRAHAERWRPWRGYASLWLWTA